MVGPMEVTEEISTLNQTGVDGDIDAFPDNIQPNASSIVTNLSRCPISAVSDRPKAKIVLRPVPTIVIKRERVSAPQSPESSEHYGSNVRTNCSQPEAGSVSKRENESPEKWNEISAEIEARFAQKHKCPSAKSTSEAFEKRAVRLKRMRELQRARYASETLEEREKRLKHTRDRARARRAAETPAQREVRVLKERLARGYHLLTPEEREAKLARSRQKRIANAQQMSGKFVPKLVGEAERAHNGMDGSTDHKLFGKPVGQQQQSSRSFKCDFCGRVGFQNERTLLTHTYRHTGEKHFQCETCGRRFISGPTLQYHQRKCGSTRFQCKQCPLSFRFRQDFELHEFTHLIPSETNDTALSIDVSGFQVETQKKSELKYLNQVPPSQSNDTWCSICRIQYSSLSALRNHAPIHSGSSKFKCVFCPKVFDGKLNFVQHTRNHTNKWPYACAKCGAGFNSKWLLTNHLKFHSEKSSDVVCQTCHKSFKSTVSLLIHMNKHKIDQGIVMNQCEFCNKSFMSKNVLRTHLRLHTGERPYLCSRCGLRFSFRSYLNKHKCAAEKHDLK
eukprot:35060_1